MDHDKFTNSAAESMAPSLRFGMIGLPFFLGPTGKQLFFNRGSGLGQVSPSVDFKATWEGGPESGAYAVNFNGTSGAGPDDFIEHNFGGSTPWPQIDNNPGDGFTGFVRMWVDALPRPWASIFLLYEGGYLSDAHTEIRLVESSPYVIRFDSKIQFSVRNIQTTNQRFGRWISFAWRQYADPVSTTMDIIVDGVLNVQSTGLGDNQSEPGNFLCIGGPSSNANSFRTYLDGRIAAIYTWNRKLGLDEMAPLWKDYAAPFRRRKSAVTYKAAAAPAPEFTPQAMMVM